MSGYGALSGAYDGLMADAAYEKRAAYLLRRLRRHRPMVRTVLDLGCGTGTIAWLLARQGLQVIAVDGSEEMLTMAAAKAAAFPDTAPPLFLHQSMPRLRLAEPVDAAVSTLDSLNYLTARRDLEQTFSRTFRWLRPGGVFYFDVNTPYKLRRMDGRLYTDETEESYCVWRTFFSEKTRICTYQVDLFRLRRDGAWTRDLEEHRERAWSADELQALLAQAGFTSVEFYGDLSLQPPGPEEDRWIVRAVKPGKTGEK